MSTGTGPGFPVVAGPVVDEQTRCVHYGTVLDIVAIRLACCAPYYPCHSCHTEHADHPAEQWPVERFDEPAVLCGVCRSTLSIATYLEVDGCPRCGAPFNPGCRAHRHLYFDGAARQ